MTGRGGGASSGRLRSAAAIEASGICNSETPTRSILRGTCLSERMSTVPEAIVRLRAIKASAPRSDGIACFARLYREVTEGVNLSARAARRSRTASSWSRSTSLFAGLFFSAFDAYERKPSKRTPGVAPLFAQRYAT